MSSLEARITKQESGSSEPRTSQEEASGPSKGTNAAAPEFVPGASSSWADEANSAADTGPEPSAVKAKAEHEMSSLAKAQTDGATEPLGGNPGVIEPSYDVNVVLSDLQADPNDPLYSAKTFEDLHL